MKNYLGRLILLVEDYEKAADFYEANFGFKRIFDQTTSVGQRILHMGIGLTDNMGIWFLKADSKEQKERIGNQTGGQPCMVIYTSSLNETHVTLTANKVEINVEPVLAKDYKFLHCRDLYGNEIVVVETK